MEVKCVVCYKTFVISEYSSSETDSLAMSCVGNPNNDLFKVFCKHMKVEPRFEWLDRPFCEECSPLIQSLYQLDNEIETLRNKTAKIAASCAATILKTFDKGKQIPSDGDIADRNKPVNEIRNSIYNQYNPLVDLTDASGFRFELCPKIEIQEQPEEYILDCENNNDGLPSLLVVTPFSADSVRTFTDYSANNQLGSDDTTNNKDFITVDGLGEFIADHMDESSVSECWQTSDYYLNNSSIREGVGCAKTRAKSNKSRTKTERGYVCTKCPPGVLKEFNSRQALLGHIERNHGSGVDCPKCGIHLSSKSTYYRHLRVVHEKSTKMIGKTRKTVHLIPNANSSIDSSESSLQRHCY